METTMNYVPLYQSESYGAHGFGLQILVAVHGRPMPDLRSHGIWHAAYKAADAITEEVQAEICAQDPAHVEAALCDKEALLACFPERIYVEEIPNEYSSRYYNRLKPWLIVTTKIGRFKIGWRKRVIHLEWTDTVVAATAEELFPEATTTKFDRVIHASNYEEAKRYIDAAILASEKAPGTAGKGEAG